jgi:CBS domain-containing protein
VLTTDALIAWIGAGACDGGQPVATLLQGPPPAIAPDASVADGILTMAAADEQSVAMTSDGTSQGRIHAILSARDFSSVFGDQPVAMLREIRYATGTRELRTLNQRVRAFALQYLTGGSSVEWVARFVHLADVGIVRRLIALAGHDSASGCWCFCGSSGREEAITRLAPLVILIHDDRSESVRQGAHQRVWEALVDCDYLPRRGLPFESSFYAASLDDWTKRDHGWMHDPIMNQLYSARAMLDLRPIEGRRDLWHAIAETVKVGATRNFLRVLANDCLDNLPPLTFFQDAVVDESGTHSHVFELQRSALNPLVDVGRVFGAAAGRVLGSSTLERFTMARALLPDHESIFREASETLRVVLWQQGRIGIGQGTDGADLPPALLGRYDRHVLRSGFRSISRLIEFTADGHWLDTR